MFPVYQVKREQCLFLQETWVVSQVLMGGIKLRPSNVGQCYRGWIGAKKRGGGWGSAIAIRAWESSSNRDLFFLNMKEKRGA